MTEQEIKLKCLELAKEITPCFNNPKDKDKVLKAAKDLWDFIESS